MANNFLPLPFVITKDPRVLDQLRQAFGILYDEDSKPIPGNEDEVKAFLSRIHSADIGIPENYPIKQVGITLEHWHETITKTPEFSEPTMTGAPEYAVSSTTLTPGQLRELQEKESIRLEKIKKIRADEKVRVENAIKRQQEIQKELAGKKIYAKVEKIERAQTSAEKSANKSIDSLKNKYKEAEHQKETVEAVTDVVQEKLTPVLKDNLSAKQIQGASEYAATTLIEAVNNPDVIKNYGNLTQKNAVLGAIAANREIVPEGARIAASSIYVNQISEVESIRSTIKFGLGEGFGQYFGPVLGDFKVTLSDTPQEGFNYTIDLGNLNQGYGNLLNQNLSFLDSVNGLTQDKIKDFAFDKLASFAESKLAAFPASDLSIAFDNTAVRNLFAVASGQPVSIAVDASFLTELSANVPGGMGLINGIGNLFGINLVAGGGASVAAAGTASVVGAEAATGAVTTAVSAAGGEAAAVAAGTVVAPGVGTAIAFVAGVVLPKVSKWIKGFFSKYGKQIAIFAGGLFGLGAGLFLGFNPFLGGILGGVGGYALAGGAGSIGSAATGFFSGAVSFFGTAGSLFVSSIGVPILVSLLSFPIVVILILFIINSGAYVVPPASLIGTTNINCTAQNSDELVRVSKNSVVSAAACIVSYLNQLNLNPLLETLLGSTSWNSLGGMLSGPAFDALERSAHVGRAGNIEGHLQCVGFASATAGLAFGQAFQQINACSYINNAPPGYKYVSGTNGISSGDFFLINGSKGCSSFSPGHIGIVVSVDGALISCADANGTFPAGFARTAHGCFALSQLAGYFRKQ